MGFYHTNIANGEFGKHKWAYAAMFVLGMAATRYNACSRMDEAYHTTKQEGVEGVLERIAEQTHAQKQRFLEPE